MLADGLIPGTGSKATIIDHGEAWQQLRASIAADTLGDSAMRQTVLDILDSEATTEQKKARLAALPCYPHLVNAYCPALRQATITIHYPAAEVQDTSAIPCDSMQATPLPAATSEHMAPTLDQTTGTAPDANFPIRQENKYTVAIKTNMLYDAMLVPNVGIELPIGMHWSVGANWMYAWWSRDSKHRYWRTYGGDVEARHWWKPKNGLRLTGHHIGVYGQMLVFDIECGHRGYMGGRPGSTLWGKAMYGGGISYGYSLAVRHNLRLDFGVRAGYLGGEYHKYTPQGDCYVWQSTHKLHYVGLTGAEAAVVWAIPCGRESKGGRP